MNPLDTALLRKLSSRDLGILDDVEQFRLLTSRHIQQLHFPVSGDAHATIGGATRATMRVLDRLLQERLISHLERRIGGVRHGSQGYVWQLTSFGDRIQRARRGERGRKRYLEPSTQFIDHTLMITSLAVTVRTLHRAGALEILALTGEPDCWREHTGPHGAVQTVKPDLYAATATGPWEDYWFIEADRDTEHLPVILNKCHIYARYTATGIEQQHIGVFPAVLWVTPTNARAEHIRAAIHADPALPDDLFRVVTMEQFPNHLTNPDL